jgi:hypothetical protein
MKAHTRIYPEPHQLMMANTVTLDNRLVDKFGG